jgi:Flp pilus assembly protein TadD
MIHKHLLAVVVCAACAVTAPDLRAAGFDEPAQATAPDVSKELARGKSLIEQTQYPAAIDELQRAERKDAKNANVQNWLGYAYRKSGQLDPAFKHYRRALELDPQHRGAHEYIGEAYLMAKQPEKAREHLARLKSICGEGCEEYRDLAKSIAQYAP